MGVSEGLHGLVPCGAWPCGASLCLQPGHCLSPPSAVLPQCLPVTQTWRSIFQSGGLLRRSDAAHFLLSWPQPCCCCCWCRLFPFLSFPPAFLRLPSSLPLVCGVSASGLTPTSQNSPVSRSLFSLRLHHRIDSAAVVCRRRRDCQFTAGAAEWCGLI